MIYLYFIRHVNDGGRADPFSGMDAAFEPDGFFRIRAIAWRRYFKGSYRATLVRTRNVKNFN